jgi:hypothetical protein
MVDPMSSGIWCEGKLIYGISVDFVAELEEDAEASMCENGVCRFGENVKI